MNGWVGRWDKGPRTARTKGITAVVRLPRPLMVVDGQHGAHFGWRAWDAPCEDIHDGCPQ